MTSTRSRTSRTPRRRTRRGDVAPPGIQAISRLDQVRVLAHPLRLRLLEIFASHTATTKQVAAMLGENATRLYHHVYALERVGLVKLAETRPNRGTVERYYRAVAQQLTLEQQIARGAGTPRAGKRLAARPATATTSQASMARELLEQAEREFAAATEGTIDPDLAPLLGRLIVRGSLAQIQRVRADLIRWLGDVGRLGADKPAGPIHSYALTLAFLPSGGDASNARPARAKRAASRTGATASRRRRVP